MEVERIADQCGRVGLWAYDWDLSINPASKVNRQFLGYEQPLRLGAGASPTCKGGYLLVLWQNFGEYRSRK